LKITVLEIHPSSQVDLEKQYDIDNDTLTIDGKTYVITIENIFRRGDQPYAIFLTALGFLSTKHIADSLF
jgi:hypothetical protein